MHRKPADGIESLARGGKGMVTVSGADFVILLSAFDLQLRIDISAAKMGQ